VDLLRRSGCEKADDQQQAPEGEAGDAASEYEDNLGDPEAIATTRAPLSSHSNKH